jgi:hypothetical protein
VLTQTQASDQWARYQAKSIKSYLYELRNDKLCLELITGGARMATNMATEYAARITGYEAKIKKNEAEESEIERQARQLESVRDDATTHSQSFSLAVIFLQVAILLSSVAALLRKKPVWVLSLLSGLARMFYFANGFFQFVH